MTENEKRIRDAALVEAERVAATFADGTRRLEALRERIRGLKFQPERRYLDAEEVQRVLLEIRHEAETDTRPDYAEVCGGGWAAAGEIARRLGLDLDAASGGRETTYPPEYEATGELTLASQMDREAGTVENGAIPAPKCKACGARHTAPCPE